MEIRTITTLRGRVAHGLLNGMAPGVLLHTIISSLIVGAITAIKAISLASLIFSGSLASFGPRGIGMALAGALILGVVVSAISSYTGMIASPQEAPIAILALVSAGIVAAMPASPPEQVLATVLVAIALTSVLSGAFFLALGTLRLGGLVRYVPYPVVGGFLAATGWLLIKGAIRLMADVSPDLGQLTALFSPATLARWLPGVLLAVVLLNVQRARRSAALPITLAVGIVLFYAVLLLTHTSLVQAEAQGWLLGPFSAGGLWQSVDALSLGIFARADWTAILRNTGNLLAILITSMAALLLNASGVELAIARDVDLNRELRAAGIGNLLSSLTGGLVGFQSLSLTGVAARLSVRTRWAGVLAALVCGIPLFFNASLLSYLPKVVLGGLLTMLGLSFLVEWLYRAWFRLPRLDYGIILLIVAVSAAIGFLEGISVGILLAVILFVLEYSRVNVIKHALTGAVRQSMFTRNKQQRQILIREGAQIVIFELQGFIFFGTSNKLHERMRDAITCATQCAVRYVLLDFRQVTGIDSSAVFSFVKMKQLAQVHGVKLVLTQLSPAMRRQLSQLDLAQPGNTIVRSFSDLDHGVEWCEDQLITAAGHALSVSTTTLPDLLVEVLPDPARVSQLLHYMQKEVVPAGHYLMRQGDEPDVMYFVESGKVTAQMEWPDRPPIRLQSMAGQNVVGEIGLYLGTVRTASVVAEEPSTVYRLSRVALQEMKAHDPELAAALHEYMAHLMAERLAHLTGVVNAVMG